MNFTSTLIAIATWGVIFVNHERNGCNGQDLIGLEPSTQAVLRGNPHTLSCRRGSGVTQQVAWVEFRDGYALTISLGGVIGTTEPKYTNFVIDTNNDNGVDFNLQINGAAVEDEGVYYCELFGTGTTSNPVTLTVEVQSSSMSMTQDGNPVTTVTVTEGETSDIVCTALAARPIVDILWYHQKRYDQSEERIMTGVTQTNTSYADGTSDTVSTLEYTASSIDFDQGSIICESTGQLVVHPVSAESIMSVQYIPVVSVQYGGYKAICSSDANPDVPLKGYADMEGYIFIVNNTDEYAPTECSDGHCTLNLAVTSDAHLTCLRCNATNAMGMGTDVTIAVPGAVIPTSTTAAVTTRHTGRPIPKVICNDTIYVAFLVILSLLLVASLVFNIVVVIRYNRLLNSGKTSDTQMESRAPKPTNHGAVAAEGDKYQELNMKSREKEHAYQQPDSSGLQQQQHIENEQGPMYEDLNNSPHDNHPTNEDAGDEGSAGGNQQSPMYVNARPTRPRNGKHDK